MSTFQKPSSLPSLPDVMDIDSLVTSSFKKELIPVPVVFVSARTDEGRFVAHKSKYIPINKTVSVNLPQQSTSLSSPINGEPSSYKSESSKVKSLSNHQSLQKSIQTKWQKQNLSFARGLVNCGNTCYLNSALQCISHTPSLANVFLNLNTPSNNNDSIHPIKLDCPYAERQIFCPLCSLLKVFSSMFSSSSRSPLEPNFVVNHLKSIGSQFRKSRQEDSHEFIRMFLDKADEACVKHHGNMKYYLDYFIAPTPVLLPGEQPFKRNQTSLLFAAFGGFLRSRVSCPKCKYNSDTFDPFMDLSIELRGSTLDKAMRAFCSPEVLDVDNTWKCGKCKQKSCPTKILSIHQPPNTLMVHLKRFKPTGAKIQRLIEYQEKIDLNPYISSDSPFNNNDNPNINNNYTLYAVLMHHGFSSFSGHYTAIVKASNGVWSHANDEFLSKSSTKQTLNHPDAYILFYTRNEPIPSNNPKKTEEIQSSFKFEFETSIKDGLSLTPKKLSTTSPTTIKTQSPLSSSTTSMDIDQLFKTPSKSNNLPNGTSHHKDSTINRDKIIPNGTSHKSSPSSSSKLATQNGLKSINKLSSSQELFAHLFGVSPANPTKFSRKGTVHEDSKGLQQTLTQAEAFKSRVMYGGASVSSWASSIPMNNDRGTPNDFIDTPSKSSHVANSVKSPKDSWRTVFERATDGGSMEVDTPINNTTITRQSASNGFNNKHHGGDREGNDSDFSIFNSSVTKSSNKAIAELQLESKLRKKRKRDSYDIEYDRGKLKKVKTKFFDDKDQTVHGYRQIGNRTIKVDQEHDYQQGPLNVFQTYADDLAAGKSPKSKSPKHVRGGQDKVKRQIKAHIKLVSSEGSSQKKYFKSPFWKSKNKKSSF